MTSGVPGHPDVYRNCDGEDFAEDVQFYNYEYPIFVEEACQVEGTGDRLTLAAMGLCGEAGEVSEMIKKYMFHGKDLDEDKLRLEMGDVLWYFTLLMGEMGFDLDEIMHANIAKLRARYGPDHGRQGAKKRVSIDLPEVGDFASTGCHGAGPGCHGV